MKNPKVSIIILNYNGLRFLEACFASIKNQTYKNIETILVDNASDDESCEYVRKFDWVKLVCNDKNYGYAEANNLATEQASGEFLLFLNNDTEVFPDMVEKLIESYEEKTIVSPEQILLVNKENGKGGMAGVGVDVFGYAYGTKPKETRVFFADGAAIFIRKKDFVELGMFDAKLFMFQEDIDLSWRAQLMEYKIVSCWQAKFYHYGGGSITGGAVKDRKENYQISYYRYYLSERNTLRNILKNYSWLFLIIILPSFFLIKFLEILFLLFILKFRVVRCYFNAYYWNIVNFGDTLRYRRQIQAKRKIGDWQLFKKMYWSYAKLKALYLLGLPKFK